MEATKSAKDPTALRVYPDGNDFERVERHWRWALEGLCRLARKRTRWSQGIPLGETVLFENGVPTQWMYCGEDDVQLTFRPNSWCSLDNVRSKFRMLARKKRIQAAGINDVLGKRREASAGDTLSAERKLATVVSRGGSVRFWTAGDLKSPSGLDQVESVSLYIEPKGVGASDFENAACYRNEYSLQTGGRVQTNSYRLGAPISTTTGGVTRRESIRSRNVQVNEQMDAATLALVRALEAEHRCKVFKCSAEYVVDASNDVWLLFTKELVTSHENTTEVQTAELTQTIEPPKNFLARKNENAKEREKLKAVEEEENLALRDFGLKGDARLTEIADVALYRTSNRNGSISKKQKQRTLSILERHKKAIGLDQSGDGDNVDLEGKEGEALQASEKGSVARATVDAGGSEPRRNSEVRKPRFTVAGALAQGGLGMQSFSSPGVSGGVAGAGRLLTNAFMHQDDPGQISDKLRKSTSTLSSSQTTSCPGDFCSVSIDVDTGDEVSGSSIAATLSKLQSAEEGGAEGPAKREKARQDDRAGKNQLVHSVSFKAVVQARAERRLVELLIKRMQKKEKGDYVQGVADLELSTLGKTYPMQYYRHVKVCDRCFRLYSKIEDARQRSLIKMSDAYPEIKRKLKQVKEEQQLALKQGKMQQQESGEGALYRDKRVNPFSAQGKELMDKSFKELKELAVKRAREAVQGLTKADVAEFRSFQSPSAGVVQVSQALMLLLTGKLLTWEASKRVMANGERFVAMLLDFDADCVPPQRITDLEPFVKDPMFRFDNLIHINKSAACFCDYILGVVQAHKYKVGTAHPRSDPLLFMDPRLCDPNPDASLQDGGESAVSGPGAQEQYQESQLVENGSFMVKIPKYLQKQIEQSKNMAKIKISSVDAAPVEKKLQAQRTALRAKEQQGGKAQEQARRPSSADKGFGAEGKRGTDGAAGKNDQLRPQSGDGSKPRMRELNLADVVDADYHGEKGAPIHSPTGLSRVQHHAIAGTQVGFNRHESIHPAVRQGRPQDKSATAPSDFGGLKGFAESEETMQFLRKRLHDNGSDAGEDAPLPRKMTKRERRARRKVQEKQMERLHGVHRPAASEGGDDNTTASTCTAKTFACSDGITTISYDVVGTGGLEGSAPNIVVFHDLFDTFESLQIFLEPVLRKHQGSQALVFNYPGQAYTRFPGESVNVLNNVFIAATLQELLDALESNGDFSCSIRPFYLLGIGNGAIAASYFALHYGTSPTYRKMLRGVVSINGYTHVDQQLAAILHSSVNIFSCFPAARPDLPISYFTRFLFSDDYLQRVDPALVLNIYTAVGNPITLQGRTSLCSGALKHHDVSAELKDLKVPLVLLQSTENVLVNPANVDSFLDGRTVTHLWSHQLLDTGRLSDKGVEQMRNALDRPDGAFVVWLKAGHEVRQEAKVQVLDVIDHLLDNSSKSGFANQLSLSASAMHIKKKEHKRKRNAKSGKDAEEEAQDLQRKSSESGDKKKASEAAAGAAPESAATKGKEKPKKAKVKSKKKRFSKALKGAAAAATGGDGDDDQDGDGDASCEFEEAMRRHRETKRLAEEARKIRLADVEKKAALEEEAMRQRLEAKEKERLEQEEKARKQFEIELEQKRAEMQQELEQQRKSEQEKIVQEMDAERERASVLASKLQKDLAENERQFEEEKTKLEQARQERERVKQEQQEAEERLKKSLEGSGLDFDKVVEEGTKASAEPRKPPQVKVYIDDDDVMRQIQLLRDEQEARRKKWEEDDRKRIEMLEAQLLKRAGKREQATCRLKEATGVNEYTYAPTNTQAAHGMFPKNACGNVIQPTSDDASAPVKEEPAAAGNDDGDEQLPPPVQEGGLAVDTAKQRPTAAAAAAQQAAPVSPSLERFKEQKKTQEATVSALDVDEYEQVKQEMIAAEEDRTALEESRRDATRQRQENKAALRLQSLARGRRARKRVVDLRRAKLKNDAKYVAALRLQAMLRGQMGRQRAAELRVVAMRDRAELNGAKLIQRVARGMLGRKKALARKKEVCAICIQCAIRIFLACCLSCKKREERDRVLREAYSATKIQSVWRMFFDRDRYMQNRILQLAALQIQRVYRGCRGRRKALRKLTWERAEPGPERLELGLSLIEDSKLAFAAQQEEIDALHRAQERAEIRVSKIHAGLQESEKELAVLEQELRDVDQLDDALHQLSHEKALLEAKSEAEERRERAKSGSKYDPNSEAARARAAESYALEMQIHIKRAERERKKKELEAEFAAVFQEVAMKRSELQHLEDNIQDMENTRKRKEREFQRLQRNLMELLEEQKNELDNLREKGIELEAATASSAAAAAATAAAAKENEERSAQMFSSTEELLKFQFMSMSLSYFSSMNMLKSLKDINSDTTSAAISASANTAAAAAAAAQAANIPSLANTTVGAQSVAAAELKEKESEVRKLKDIDEAKKALETPFPDDVRKWTVQDVARWLDTLSLGQYREAFVDACIDGEFLLELRVEDMRDILGMKHALHVTKLDLARSKLRPLDVNELFRKKAVDHEAKTSAMRSADPIEEIVPDADTVFSQIRNGRFSKLEKALDLGFEPNAQDSYGNTALIIACQNLNRKMVELLLNRRANINHQNLNGNTAMHFAMAYDPEGTLGEYLISRGADDTLENNVGLSPYDGLEL